MSCFKVIPCSPQAAEGSPSSVRRNSPHVAHDVTHSRQSSSLLTASETETLSAEENSLLSSIWNPIAACCTLGKEENTLVSVGLCGPFVLLEDDSFRSRAGVASPWVDSAEDEDGDGDDEAFDLPWLRTTSGLHVCVKVDGSFVGYVPSACRELANQQAADLLWDDMMAFCNFQNGQQSGEALQSAVRIEDQQPEQDHEMSFTDEFEHDLDEYLLEFAQCKAEFDAWQASRRRITDVTSADEAIILSSTEMDVAEQMVSGLVVSKPITALQGSQDEAPQAILVPSSWAEMIDESDEDEDFDIPWESKTSSMKTEIATSLNAIEPFVHPSLSSPVELHSGTNRSDASEEERKEVVGEDAPVDDSPAAYLCTARVAIIEELAAYKDEVHDAKIWAIRHSQERVEARAEAPPVRRQRVTLHGKAYRTHDGNPVASPFATIALPSMFAGNAPEKAKSWADIDDDDDEDIHMPDWLRDSLEAQAAQAQTQNDSSEASRGEQIEENPKAEQRRSTSWADMMDENDAMDKNDADDENDENEKLIMPDWLQQTVRARDCYLNKLDEQCLLEADPAAYLVEARRDFIAYLKRQEGVDLRAEIAALEDPASIGVAHVDEPQRRCTVGRLHGSLCWTAISCEKRDSSLHYESISEVDEVDEVQTEDDAWDDDKTMEAIDDETAKLFGLPCYDAQQGVDEDAWQDDGRRPVDAARCSPFTTHGTTASLSYDHTSLFGRSPSGIRARSLERPADCVAGSILPLIDRSIWHSEMYRSVD